MREMTAAMAAAIDGEVTSLAFCWRVGRSDGAALGFTSHDRTIVCDGMVFAPSPGMTPSAVQVSDDIEGGGMAVAGALSNRAIRAIDIADGRYDGARVELTVIDWRQPAAGVILLASGTIGDIERRGASFEAELQTVQARLGAVPVELCSPECRARLGDARCRVDLHALTRRARVTATGTATTLSIDNAGAGNAYAYGRLRPLAGRLAGLDFEITASASSAITLRDPVARALRPGDLVELREGCDRRFATCRDRFANQLNFRGEPHVPGTDSMIRYPSL